MFLMHPGRRSRIHRHSLVLRNLGEAVHGPLVDPLGLRLLGLHLKAATHRVERVRSVRSRESGRLRTRELRGQADGAALLLVPARRSPLAIHVSDYAKPLVTPMIEIENSGV